MKQLNFLLFVAFVFLIACNSNSNQKNSENKKNEETTDNVNNETKNETDKEEAENTKVAFSIEKFNQDEAEKLDHKGQIVYGKAWKDVNGENMIILTERTDYVNEKDGPGHSNSELHAYHYTDDGKGYILQREVKDFEQKCMFDNRARFVEESLNLTDIDEDGIAEITFVYRLGCTSELSPDGLKLMMLENGDKYAIRGNTEVDFTGDGSQMFGGETNIDKSFDNAPAGFKDFAKKLWKEQQQHNIIWDKPRPYLLKKVEKYTKAKIGGVEPNWTVKLEKDHLMLTPNMGETQIKFNYTEISELDNGLSISAEKPGAGPYSAMGINITEDNCSDGMSDNTYPIKVDVNYFKNKKNAKLHGCGRW